MKIKNLNHLVAMLMLLTTTGVLAADTVRVAMIEMLSGPGAGIGTWMSHHFRWAVDQLNASGGVLGAKVEIVEFDNKSSPQEALLALKRTRDEGIRFVFGGSSSRSRTREIQRARRSFSTTQDSIHRLQTRSVTFGTFGSMHM